MRVSAAFPYLQAGTKLATPQRSRLFPWRLTPIPTCSTSPFSRHSSSKSAQEAAGALDGRVRLSRLWAPTGGMATSSSEDSHTKLIRAGFLRQAHSGVFHMLPLGRRIQDKLEALIDKYMYQLGASKLALSSISSEELWTKSGRLNTAGSELFRFRDRKDARLLLSPTHEEEITSLVSNVVRSYKDLPVRLYQISRKYRDERRPRHGLLRSREFIMKDLYTFDLTPSRALSTYDQVRAAYARLFDELKLPYLVAEADSGDMGGNLSHEFHFPTSKGEDHVISCSSCDYVANEELAESVVPKVANKGSKQEAGEAFEGTKTKTSVWRGISQDRRTLINVWYPSPAFSSAAGQLTPEVNVHAVKTVFPDLDASVDNALPLWENTGSAENETAEPIRLMNLVDGRLSDDVQSTIIAKDPHLPFWPASVESRPSVTDIHVIHSNPSSQQPLNLLRIMDGDSCPRCLNGKLAVQKAIELGHTFHLGTRYSEPLSANVTLPAEESGIVGVEPASRQIAMQMGCHGIGVSRMIGAVADTLTDDKGLNWPRVMAPYEVVIVPGTGLDEAALVVYDELCKPPTVPGADQPDLILDDRAQSFPWKMRDADLVGYPVIIVVGRRWKAEGKCEVQCRRLKIRQEIAVKELAEFVKSVLSRL